MIDHYTPPKLLLLASQNLKKRFSLENFETAKSIELDPGHHPEYAASSVPEYAELSGLYCEPYELETRKMLSSFSLVLAGGRLLCPRTTVRCGAAGPAISSTLITHAQQHQKHKTPNTTHRPAMWPLAAAARQYQERD